MRRERDSFDSPYTDDLLAHLAYPMGGLGAGMICLEGAGALSHVSVRGELNIQNEPLMFAALSIQGQPDLTRLLEGPVPEWKIFSQPNAGKGLGLMDYGLPRFDKATFRSRFPFGIITLNEDLMPLKVEITGWSPFVPGDPDSSSLPVAGLEYSFHNPTDSIVNAVFSFHARNFMAISKTESGTVRDTRNGFILIGEGSVEKPWEQGAFSAAVDDPGTIVNCALFRGRGADLTTMLWKTISAGSMAAGAPIQDGPPSPGGSLYVPVNLHPGESTVIRLRLAWYAPVTNLRLGKDNEEGVACCEGNCDGTHIPWYAGVFDSIEAVTGYWNSHYDALKAKTQAFTEAFYDTTLPPEVVESVAANLTILKSPTVQRQTDGKLWCWEGCNDNSGCCHGSCTHVWNYAMAIPHLFPSLERSLRETEFFVDQDKRGHQTFRASLPIRPPDHDFHAAADGQLGGIMRVYREWRICGDELWLRRFWPKVRQSLNYCIETWDPEHQGVLSEPHHNTYDIEFWGPDGMCTSFYLGALKAAVSMANGLGDEVPLYQDLLDKGVAYMESELWDGEYFIQKIQWVGLRAPDPTKAQSTTSYSPEAEALLRLEGPKYQYGQGCLSDGVLGVWIASMCGVGDFLDPDKVLSHLNAVYTYNLKHNLKKHVNPQRTTYALGDDGGLLLCTWPKGGALSLPFVYSNEVWTGIEYQVAAHLLMMGKIEAGLEIVRVVRDRYDSHVRNPFDEYECGHWYARALASYGLIQGLSGAWYDAVEKTLILMPTVKGDFRAFLSTATGFGTVGVKDGKPFVEVVSGTIPYERIDYIPQV